MRKINWFYVLFLFNLLAIIGGILEIMYMLVFKQRFVIGGFLSAPFRPIYGFGGLLLYFMPQYLKKNNIFIFLSSLVICSIFEYITSFLLELFCHIKIWDYSKFMLNINGRICLLHSCIWGILGICFIIYIEPLILKLYKNLSTTRLNYRKSGGKI